MSNLPQQNTIVQYVSDGITDTYVVPFYTPVETDGTPDLAVFAQLTSAPPNPVDDLKQWNVDYTYTANFDPISGGILTFLPGHIPPISYAITIVRDVSASLDVEFSQAANFSGITLDAALDKLVLISQQNKSYTLERNLSYIVNSYLPESTISANVQIPVLASGQVWFGSANGVIAATLEQPADVSTLRSQLANNQPTTNGAALVGYYDVDNLDATTVAAQLTYLTGLAEAATPVGCMYDFAGTIPPSGFLVCDGSSVSRATYANLYAVIGTTWGSVDGSHFTLPDFRRRVGMGSGGVGTAVIGNAVGNHGGSETETLTDATQLPAHTHTYLQTQLQPGAGANTGGSASNLVFPQGTTQTGSTGASAAFDIIQPAAIVLKIIKF